MGITFVIGDNSWKFHDDTMMGTLSKRCHRQTDRRTEIAILKAAWSQLKSKAPRDWLCVRRIHRSSGVSLQKGTALGKAFPYHRGHVHFYRMQAELHYATKYIYGLLCSILLPLSVVSSWCVDAHDALIHFKPIFSVPSLSVKQWYDCPTISEVIMKNMCKIDHCLTQTNPRDVYLFWPESCP